jgi:hypothetical protein
MFFGGHKMHIIEHNVETGEVKEVAMTAAQIKVYEAEVKIMEELATARQETAAQKATDKAALLTKLGITDDEAKLLLS